MCQLHRVQPRLAVTSIVAGSRVPNSLVPDAHLAHRLALRRRLARSGWRPLLRACSIAGIAVAVSGGAVMVVTPAAAQAPQRGATPPPSPQAIERARQIVSDARKAMGGDKL